MVSFMAPSAVTRTRAPSPFGFSLISMMIFASYWSALRGKKGLGGSLSSTHSLKASSVRALSSIQAFRASLSWPWALAPSHALLATRAGLSADLQG